MKLRKALLAAFLCTALIVAGCGAKGGDSTTDSAQSTNEQTPASEKDKDTLIYAVREINATLDSCQKLTDGYLRRVAAAEPMFLITPEGEVVPGFIKEGRQIDENTWELQLRDNAKFWSGKEVTGEEVLKSIERTRTESADGESILEGVTFETTDDDYVIKAITKKKNQDIPFTLTNITIHNADMDFTTVESTDYTGMYKIVEYVPKQKLVLEANEDYWGDIPKIKNIIYEEIADDDTRILAGLSKRADITADITPINATQFEGNDDIVLHTVNPSGSLSVYLNINKPFLSDIRVRQALNWALDRKQIADIASEGFGISTSTWLGTNPLYYSEREKVYDKQDIKKAEELLKEAGFTKNSDGKLEKDGKVFTFKFYTWGSDQILGELVQNAWMDLGVDVELSHVDYSVIENARETDDWDGFIETWVNYGDMYSVLSKQFVKGGSINYVDYENPEVTKLIDSLKEENDPEKIKEISKKVNELTAIDAPLVPLMPRPSTVAVNKSLTGYTPNFIFAQPVINSQMEFTE